MPIDSSISPEMLEDASSELAAIGVTTSMGASAARLIADDPDYELGGRLSAALEQIGTRFGSTAEQLRRPELGDYLLSRPQVAAPESVLASLASDETQAGDVGERVTAARTLAEQISSDAQLLLGGSDGERSADSIVTAAERLASVLSSLVDVISSEIGRLQSQDRDLRHRLNPQFA